MLQEKKHCEHLALYSQTSRISFTPISKSQSPSPSLPIQTPDNSSKISTLDLYVMTDSVTDAEIRWALRNVLSSFSFCSCDGLSCLFKTMFSTSVVAEKFSLQKDKCVMEQLHISDPFLLTRYESLNTTLHHLMKT